MNTQEMNKEIQTTTTKHLEVSGMKAWKIALIGVAIGVGLFSTQAPDAHAAVTVEAVVNGEFTGGNVFSDNGWTTPVTGNWASPGVWVFNPNASDRIEDLASGGNPNGYIANGTGADGLNTAYGVFDLSTLSGPLAGGNATFSFDILNDTGANISYNYSVWYADETATGNPGGFGGIAGVNMAFGGGTDTRIINGTGTALAAATGWNTDQVSVVFDLDTINFAGDGVGSISSLGDVNRLVIGLEFNNSSANLDAGIDNVSFLLDVTPIPEPSTLAMIVIGLAGMAARRKQLLS